MGVSRASFASAEDTRELTGMEIGGVTALALPADLPIYADQRLLEMDYVILGAGSRSAKLKMPPAELSKLPNPAVRRWSCRWRRNDTMIAGRFKRVKALTRTHFNLSLRPRT